MNPPSSGFLRPGERRGAAFGVSFAVPDDSSTSAQVLPYNKFGYLRISEQQERLPIYAYKRDVLYLVERHATTIVVGETGSGKSTQVPQYLHRAGWAPKGLQIACAQPSRFAAVTVAARVAEEMGVRLGDEVGYGVDFEDVSNDATTRIKFCTNDVLIKEMAVDPLLSRYSVVMVDEAHERTLSTDLLLGLLKKIQKKRKLRVVISSATIHAEKFARFFSSERDNRGGGGDGGGGGGGSGRMPGDGATADRPSGTPAILSVQGRPHSVQVSYLKEPCQEYVRAALEAVEDIRRSDVPGDILVFLTSQEECERAVDWIKTQDQHEDADRDGRRTGRDRRDRRDRRDQRDQREHRHQRLHAVALYAGLPTKHQLAVFEAPPRGQRKVVFATNIAETSLTIDGIVHVVDCMFARQRAFDPIAGLETSCVAPVSKASATQRSGRAGRVRPGFAFRLCTKAAYDALGDADVPEIQRSDLTQTVLRLKGLGIDNLLQFAWMAPPPSEMLVRSLESLYALGALGDDARLTDSVGRYMTEFVEIDPRLARCVLAAWNLNCVYEVVTIASMLHVRHVWSPGGKKSRDARSQFAVKEGDLVTYLNVWRGWEQNRRSPKWAYKNYIWHKSLCRAQEIRNEMLQTVARLKRQSPPDDPVFSGCSLDCLRDNVLLRKGLASAEVEERIANARRALAAGLFLNAAELETSRTTTQGQPIYRLLRERGGGTGSDGDITIHRDSVVFSDDADRPTAQQPATICFYDAQQTETGIETRLVHPVEASWLADSGYFHFGRRERF